MVVDIGRKVGAASTYTSVALHVFVRHSVAHIYARRRLLQVSSYAGPAKESVGTNALYAAFVASGAASKCMSSFQVGKNLASLALSLLRFVCVVSPCFSLVIFFLLLLGKQSYIFESLGKYIEIAPPPSPSPLSKSGSRKCRDISIDFLLFHRSLRDARAASLLCFYTYTPIRAPWSFTF